MAIVLDIPERESEQFAKLKRFLYLVLRDYMTAGEIEAVIEECSYPNGYALKHLADYAMDVARRLLNADPD